MVGGAVGSHAENFWNARNKLDIQRANNGHCYDRVEYPHRMPLPQFEADCHITDIVQNFFLARTLTAGTIRMDPQFKQRGHREWFLDAIGKLRIAWCGKSLILHENSNCQDHATTYGKFRSPGGASGAELNRQIDE